MADPSIENGRTDGVPRQPSFSVPRKSLANQARTAVLEGFRPGYVHRRNAQTSRQVVAAVDHDDWSEPCAALAATQVQNVDESFATVTPVRCFSNFTQGVVPVDSY